MAGAARVLERGPALDALGESHTAGGILALVAGEAGAGKTTLLRAFADRTGGPVWWGRCDPLTTPRPMGPVLDIAEQGGNGVAEVLRAARTPHDAYAGFLTLLREAPPGLVVVLEDVHWADEATADLLRFLGRRVGTTAALVVATYRDDEVHSDHPLVGVVGDLVRQPAVRRLQLPPLSAAAVAVLCRGTELDPQRVHELTGGNAFFVSELVGAGDYTARSLADAVLARRAELGPSARRVVEAVATDPRELETRYAARLAGADVDAVDEAARSGLLVPEPEALRFRHELARQTIYAGTDAGRRAAMHTRMVGILVADASQDHSRLAHHASASGDPALVLAHAPVAARDSVRRGAGREAARFYRAALARSELLDPASAAELRIELARTLTNLNRPQEALTEARSAVRLAERTGDTTMSGRAAVLLARCLWLVGQVGEANRVHEDGVRLLEADGPSEWLADALVAGAGNAMLGRHHQRATEQAARALAVAEAVGSPNQVLTARMMGGTAELVTGDPDRGVELLTEVLDECVAAGNREVESRVLGMLGSGGGEVRRYEAAMAWLERGTAVSRDLDQDHTVAYNQAWQARIRFEQGRWSEATTLAEGPAGMSTDSAVISPMTALAVLGRVRTRRGDPGARAPLDAALEMGVAAELQHRWPAHCGTAELLWWEGSSDEARRHLRRPYEQALDCDSSWALGELGYWLWRVGGLEEPHPRAAAPFACMMRGEWSRAAALWRDLGCPYEEAMALAEGDVEAQLSAVRLLDRLGARPAGGWVRSRLRHDGVSVPRGPRASTRANGDGLTDRQAEVRDLMRQGLTNSQIAERLFISPKTAEHHVSAVLAKLGVASREELARSDAT